MAGTPKKRAREKEAAAKAAELPPMAKEAPEEAATRPRSRTRVTRPATRARAPGGGDTAPASPTTAAAAIGMDAGSHVKREVDTHRAELLHKLGEQLRPGLVVRIERTRPTWCCGFIEHFTLEEGTYGELLEYVRQEHGGQRYTFTVLTFNGSPLMQVSEPVQGQPREAGRVIDRVQWDAAMRGEAPGAAPAGYVPGHAAREATAMEMALRIAEMMKPAAAPAPAPQFDMLEFLGLFLTESRESRNQLNESLKLTAEANQRQTNELLAAMAKGTEGVSFGSQLEGLRSSMSKLNEIQEELRPEPEEAPEDLRSGADSMGKQMMEGFMRAKFGLPSGTPTQGAQPPRYARTPVAPQSHVRPKATGTDGNVIPFARERDE